MKPILERFNKHYWMFYLIFFFCVWHPCLAQFTQWKSFSTADGLGDVEVYTIFESPSTGDLWFGTRSGATRYDGTWKNFILSDAFGCNNVRAIAEFDSGYIWFGTEEGAKILQEGTIIEGPDTLANDTIWVITKNESKNQWWFGTSNGAFRYEPGAISEWRKFYILGGQVNNEVRNISVDNKGYVWFGTLQGLYRLDASDNWDGSFLETSIISDIMEDIDHKLWIATDGDGVYSLDSDNLIREGGEVIPVHVSAVEQDWEGNFLFSTYGHGVIWYDGIANWDTLNIEDGLAHNYVFDIKEDSYRNMWFATRWDGVSRYESSWRIFLHQENGFTSHEILALEKDNYNNIWAGLSGAGIYRYDGKNFKPVNDENGKPYQKAIYAIEKDSAGIMWFGTWGDGIKISTDSTLSSVPGPLDNRNVISILEDSNKDLWFGTRYKGVYRYECKDTIWTQFTTDSGLADKAVKDIFEDHEGVLWFATNGGVSSYDGMEWQTFNKDLNGLPSDKISAIAEDNKGTLWFATYNKGVISYDRSNWDFLGTGQGLVSDEVNSILFDHNNNRLWFGTSRGANRFTPYNDNYLWRLFKTFTTGLPHDWVNTILLEPKLNELTKDTASILWFGTKNGIARYLGEAFPPETIILTSDNKTFTTAKPVFEFSGRDNISTLHEISYSYSIFRIDSAGDRHDVLGGWSEFSFDTRVVVPLPLENGAYEIFVRARDGDGNIDPTPEKRTFTIDPLLIKKNIGSRGGYIITSQGDKYVKIYIPPGALDEIVKIQINTINDSEILKQLEDTFIGYNIIIVDDDESGQTIPSKKLYKTATISIKDPVITQNIKSKKYLTMYHTPSTIDTIWSRLGGTVDFENHTIIAPFKSFGKFTVRIDSIIYVSAQAIKDLNCRPRVFSTISSELTNHTDIIFTLGKTAPVTVRIYNMAGRLIRVIKTQQPLFSGENVIPWDGINDAGERCVSGLYIICALVEGKKEFKTVAIVNK